MPPRLRWAGAGSKRDGTQSTLHHRGSSRAQHYQPPTLRFHAGGTKISSEPWHWGFMLKDLHPSLAKEVSWFRCQEKNSLGHLSADYKPHLCCNAWWFGDDGKGSASSGVPPGLQSISQDLEGMQEFSKILNKS